ncbi:hypothetical protein CAEBREN_20742 [Caenorhabditis brenneri]|uniref:Uncharacterized protein n=1 Tax=Caenorhabditis brenneri TaxID=135651 RepID=G0NFP4_CAEBE|nr:hypothetical protein CAEBREN_20742 [Caenorhabditis brenneri]
MFFFFNSGHAAKKKALRLEAEFGYPITEIPFFPSVLVYSVDTQTIGEHAKIILADENSKYVQKKSLKFIWEFLVKYFKAPYFPRSIVQELQKSQFPANTLAVSFAMRFFKVGQRCNDFLPIKEPSELVKYTYQRVSENIQVTYMNLNGKEYLAGICYYAAVHGMPKMMSLDTKLLFMKFACSNQYLPDCRRPSNCYAGIQYYSRDCKIAGKSVVVDFKDLQRGVCHKEIDFSKDDAYKYTECPECAEEFENYDWMWPVATVTAPAIDTKAPEAAESKNPRKNEPHPLSSTPLFKRVETMIKNARVSPVDVKKASEVAESNGSTRVTTDPLGVTSFLEPLTALTPVGVVSKPAAEPLGAAVSVATQREKSKSALSRPGDATVTNAQPLDEELSKSLQSLLNLELDLSCEVKPLERSTKPPRAKPRAKYGGTQPSQLLSQVETPKDATTVSPQDTETAIHHCLLNPDSKETQKEEPIDVSSSPPRTLMESNPAQALSLLESVIAESDIPCEGPEQVCPFSPTKPLMETDPARALSLLKSVIADSDVPCEGPEEVCPFTPTKSLLETDPAHARSLLEQSVNSVDGSIFDEVLQQDDDTQSSTSSDHEFYSCSSSPTPGPSDPSDFSEHSPPTSSMESLLEDLDAIEAECRWTKAKAAQEVIASASSTESLVDGYDQLEEGVTDLDSDIEIKMLSRLRREVEKDKLILQARQGYPITRTPYVPPILDLVVDTKTLQEYDVMLKLFLAKDGSDLVKTKSLEFIRQRLMNYFINYPAIHQGLKESPFPCNTIAVTFTTLNFHVGDTCTEFIPTEGKWESGYFTHQRLSENLQSTHLNLDGRQYLAGLCYYPVVHGMPKMINLNRNLINQAIGGVEVYPSADRTLALAYDKYHVYGRYCETAGKRVLVNFADENRGVCHQEIDYTKKNASKFTRCEECAEEKKTYKWVPPRKVATVTPPTFKVQESAPKDQLPSEETEMISFLKSADIGLPELKTLVSNAATNAQETSRKNVEQPKRNVTTIRIVLSYPPTQTSKAVVSGTNEDSTVTSDLDVLKEQLPESVKLLGLTSVKTVVDEPSEEVAAVKNAPVASPIPLLKTNPAHDPCLSESVVADSVIPYEEPEKACFFTPTKLLLETEGIRAQSRVESVAAEDGSLDDEVPDEDTQSSTSAESIPAFPVLVPYLSEFTTFSEKELEKLQEQLHEDTTYDEELEVGVSSASSTESLMDDFENVEEEITDIDSDIDAEIVN